MVDTVRAALVQTDWTGDKDSMIKKHITYARQAADQGAQVMVGLAVVPSQWSHAFGSEPTPAGRLVGWQPQETSALAQRRSHQPRALPARCP